MQQEYPLFNAIAMSRTFKRMNEILQNLIQTKDRILPTVVWIVEETIMKTTLPSGFVFIYTVRHDHVVNTLISVSRHMRILAHNIEIFFDATNPMLTSILFQILSLTDE